MKAEHLKLSGLLQEIQVATWKWEEINMDFVVGLPRTHWKNDSLWVVVDRLTKSNHFISAKSTNSVEEYARIYINNILSLHVIPLSIISDRGFQFTPKFWRSFQKGFGTQVKLSTPFHPQIDGQAERNIRTLEDILRSCVIYFKGC